MSSSAVVTAPPPGAGRMRDFEWPEPAFLRNAPNAVVTNRLATELGGGGASPSALVGSVGGGTADSVLVVQGVDVVVMNSTVAAGVFKRFDPMMFHPKTVLNAITPGSDDAHVTRVLFNLAIKIAPASNEVGCSITHTTIASGRIISDLATGFGIQLQGLNVAQFLVRGPNGLIVRPLTAAPFDCTQLHTYEFRIIGATATSAAQLQVLIDGVVQVMPATSQSWAAGTDLPSPAVLGGVVGFSPAIYNTAQNINQLYVQKVRMMQGPTVRSTL